MKKWITPYIFLMVASAGYYGYYRKSEDALIWTWLLLFIIGIALLSYNNYILFKKTRSKLIMVDMIIVLGIVLIPLVPSNFGLSIIVMFILTTMVAYYLAKKKEKLALIKQN